MRADGHLAAFPEQFAFGGRPGLQDLGRVPVVADGDHLFQQRIESRLRAVQFDHQHSRGIAGNAQREGVFHGVEDAAVHQLQRGRQDARSDDLAHDLRGVVDRGERGADRAASLRQPRQPSPNLGNDRQRPFAAANDSRQVQCGRVLHRSEFYDLSVGQHNLQPGDVICRHALFERVRAAGIGGHVAADRGRALAGRIGGVMIPGPGQPLA